MVSCEVVVTVSAAQSEEIVIQQKKEFIEPHDVKQIKKSKSVKSSRATLSNTISASPPNVSSFMFGAVLGQGSYAKVYHALYKQTKSNFAIKIMDQEFIKREKKVPYVVMERQVMSKLLHPRVVKFFCSFKDDESLYMVMELCRGGELLSVICKERDRNLNKGIRNVALPLKVVQFYMVELIEGLEYIHSKNIVHRDLKPDNILLSETGHIKITDFGTAKDNESNDENCNGFCGTAEYVSPEVLNDQDATLSSDLWALGCILYQLFVGNPPFHGENDYLTFQQIILHNSDNMTFPPTFPADAADLCRKLLQVNPLERIGCDSYDEIKQHQFFNGVNWNDLKSLTPPILPDLLQLKPPTSDGASKNWSIHGAFKDMSLDLMEDMSTCSEINVSNQAFQLQTGHKLVENNEIILMQSSVKLHSILFKRSRQLLVTSNSRILLANAKSTEIKLEIEWNENVRVKINNNHTFDIITPNCSIRLTDSFNEAHLWAQLINKTSQ